jgi:N-acetylneuraminate synthase
VPFLPVLFKRQIALGNRVVADGAPTYVIAEIGINHNGSLEIAKQLIDGAVETGCDCVKFQKRTPELCVPPDQRYQERETPWGRMTYLEYRRRVEFGRDEYEAIDRHCRARGIEWTASCWDPPSVKFIACFEVPFFKAASASLTDLALLRAMRRTGKPLMLSTGMSTTEEIRTAVKAVGTRKLLIAHSTSAYPCPPQEINLRMITTLRKSFPYTPIGYSGHEIDITPSCTAVAIGASFVERHVTLDRTMWGSDQAASLELPQLGELVAGIRHVERVLGNGRKQVYASELGALKRLRRFSQELTAAAS